MAVNSQVDVRGNDTGASYRTWGLRYGDACNQYLGFVPIREGLAVAFPNLYQQKNATVELDDPDNIGRFSAISVYLVDPDARPIISTSHVSPQQKDWILRELQRTIDARFPSELLERISSEVEGLWTEEDAENYRREMSAERDHFNYRNNEAYFSLPFTGVTPHIPP